MLNFYLQRHCLLETESIKLFQVVSSTTPFICLKNFALILPVYVKICSSFRFSGISAKEILSSTYVRAEERRFLASCRELRRRAEAAAEEAATGNDERIFQLAAPAEMRRLCLSINMRRDKATRSFIRFYPRQCREWVSGSSGLGPARYILSFITTFHAHFSSCPRSYIRCCFHSPI